MFEETSRASTVADRPPCLAPAHNVISLRHSDEIDVPLRAPKQLVSFLSHNDQVGYGVYSFWISEWFGDSFRI